jgi:hypothetical protein
MDGNYSSPIMVNGYSCDNCAQVALAKKDINPAQPSTGPSAPAETPAVTLGGALAAASGDVTASGQGQSKGFELQPSWLNLFV